MGCVGSVDSSLHWLGRCEQGTPTRMTGGMGVNSPTISEVLLCMRYQVYRDQGQANLTISSSTVESSDTSKSSQQQLRLQTPSSLKSHVLKSIKQH
jgi:hypothetical protein